MIHKITQAEFDRLSTVAYRKPIQWPHNDKHWAIDLFGAEAELKKYQLPRDRHIISVEIVDDLQAQSE